MDLENFEGRLSGDFDTNYDFALSDTDEFGSDFYIRNPGIVHAQRAMHQNLDGIRLQQQMLSNYFEPKSLKVNLSYDFRVKGYGLNQNKRGNLKINDRKRFIDSLRSQEIENKKNKNFKQNSMAEFNYNMRCKFYDEIQAESQKKLETIKDKMSEVQQQINFTISGQINHYKNLNEFMKLENSRNEHQEELKINSSNQNKEQILQKSLILSKSNCRSRKNSHYVSEQIQVEQSDRNMQPSRKAQSQDFDDEQPQIYTDNSYVSNNMGQGMLGKILASNSKESNPQTYISSSSELNHQQNLVMMILKVVHFDNKQPSSQGSEILSKNFNVVQKLQNYKIDYDVRKINLLTENEVQQVMTLLYLFERTIKDEEGSNFKRWSHNSSGFSKRLKGDIGNLPQSWINGSYEEVQQFPKDLVSVNDLSNNSQRRSAGKNKEEAVNVFRQRYQQGWFRKSTQSQNSNKWGNNSSLSKKSSTQSKNRRQKMESLNMDYQDYFRTFQSMFIVRCQLMIFQYHSFKQRHDIQRLMTGIKNFEKMQNLFVSSYPKNTKTLVIDIENTLVTKYELKNHNELEVLKSSEKFEQDFIIIDLNQFKKSNADICQKEGCICHILVYKIRPYTCEMLRAIQPFFELIIFTNMPKKVANFITQKIEDILNEPIKEQIQLIAKYNQINNNSKQQRITQLPQPKVYFNFIINEKHYLQIKELNESFENLLLLTKNRSKDNIIFLSSNPFRLIAGISQGFLFIPVIPLEQSFKNDYQLNIVENYLLQQRHLGQFASKIRKDFMFLTRIQSKQSAELPEPFKIEESKQSLEDGSFTKLEKREIEVLPAPEVESFRSRPQRVRSSHDLSEQEEEKVSGEPSTQRIIYRTDFQKNIQAPQIQYDAQQIIIEEGTEGSQSNDCQSANIGQY